jgi:hypothetical protein
MEIYILEGIIMSWYRIAQQDNWNNIINTGTVGTQSNPDGIKVSISDYNLLKSFGSGSKPVTVLDLDTKQQVAVVHGGLDPEGNFAFSKGNNEYVYPDNNPNWAQELGVNPNSYIVSCYAGTANASNFKTPNYKGKLNLQIPTQVPSGANEVRINIEGG